MDRRRALDQLDSFVRKQTGCPSLHSFYAQLGVQMESAAKQVSVKLMNSARAPTDPEAYTPSIDEVKQLINWKPVFYYAKVDSRDEFESEPEPKRRKQGFTSSNVSSEALINATTRRHNPMFANPGMSGEELRKKLPTQDTRVFTKQLKPLLEPSQEKREVFNLAGSIDIETCSLVEFVAWHQNLHGFCNRKHFLIEPELQQYLEKKKNIVKDRDVKLFKLLAREKGRETRDAAIDEAMEAAIASFFK